MVTPSIAFAQYKPSYLNFAFRVTAKKVKLHSCLMSLSVCAPTPGGLGKTPNGVS